jgi:putative hydrolase of the HAD superfamily
VFVTVRAVLFDAVGTLIRAEPPVDQAYCEAGRRFGSTLSRQEIGRRFLAAFERQEEDNRAAGRRGAEAGGRLHRAATDQRGERRRWRRIVAEVFDDTPAAAGPLFEALWDHFAESKNWALFDDAGAVWRLLQQRGFTLGVASNFDDRLAAICRGIDLPIRAEHVFYSSRLGHPKPSPRFFRAVEQRLELPPEQILLVGDDLENDYHGARAAGWRAVLLDRRQGVSQPSCIRSLAEVAELLAMR